MKETPDKFLYPVFEWDFPSSNVLTPDFIRLRVRKLSVRGHKDTELDEYFYFTLQLPEKRDEGGFVWEKELRPVTVDPDKSMEDSLQTNSIPCCKKICPVLEAG
jgi:hypothetical protein